MFRPMRRKRQLLSETESISLLKASTSGVLSLLGDEGYPYGVPLSYVYDDGKIYFHSAVSGHKIDAIIGYDKASFTVISQDHIIVEEFTTYFRSVIAFGRVHIVDDEDEKRRAISMIADRYSPHANPESKEREISKGFQHMHLIAFDIEHLTGKEAIELVQDKSGTHPCR
jgi:nitroimidazol reductase NimA-like FMN-containing flavoprotein (pyridoxamine 5'-phosphate oxidase superfamily)